MYHTFLRADLSPRACARSSLYFRRDCHPHHVTCKDDISRREFKSCIAMARKYLLSDRNHIKLFLSRLCLKFYHDGFHFSWIRYQLFLVIKHSSIQICYRDRNRKNFDVCRGDLTHRPFTLLLFVYFEKIIHSHKY